MHSSKPKVLLVGEYPPGFSCWAQHLERRGCECNFAATFQETCSLLPSTTFDLVLSPLRLRNHSCFPLIGLLEGSSATLFYSLPVEEGCWWLPAVRGGQNCFGTYALRSSEFMAALDEAIEEVRSGARLPDQRQQPLAVQPAGPVFVLPQSLGEPLPAKPVRAGSRSLVKRKSAGE